MRVEGGRRKDEGGGWKKKVWCVTVQNYVIYSLK